MKVAGVSKGLFVRMTLILSDLYVLDGLVEFYD